MSGGREEWPDYGRLDPSRAIARRSDVVVGAVVFIRDENRRVYDRKYGSGPIPRHFFVPQEVVGETSKSWLVGAWKQKVPKSYAAAIYGLADVEDALWVHSYAWRIADAVRRHANADDLRAIAKLVGFDPEPSLEASAS